MFQPHMQTETWASDNPYLWQEQRRDVPDVTVTDMRW